ncbi:hypothetical protein [Rhodohalobacter mucosus]|uniref:6-bladed beta-propeller protein n=1 Tax=Rhodohalobacter mucosus TaxID=2079485 RepID=A0A316TPF5_9BACT|nr:hypothetical protein [Rhodohalobacter mucosus]PWN06493.1 hypothetical protein DDZ15_08195 [Rhodohalobacter mucosus]
MYKNLTAVIGFFIFLSCTENQSLYDKSEDLFLAQLTSEIREVAVIGSTEINTPTVNRLGDILRWSDDRLIVVDLSLLTLNLLKADGSDVASAGGRGRGPGEFELINQLHRGSDGYLYVLDRNLTRVSKFQIADDEIDYVTSFSPDVPDTMFLVNIFVTPSGVYTLLNHFEANITRANSYRLYKADGTFNSDELLFEFEGTEKIESDNGLYIDHPLARQPLWSQNGDYFYLLNSHQSEWQKRNLLTGAIDSISYVNQTERKNNHLSKAYLTNRLEPILDVEPVLKEFIDKSGQLPLNHDLFATKEWVVISSFYAGSSEKIIVLHNQVSKETVYCSVAPHFFPVSFNGNKLTGKNSSTEDNIRLEVLDLELPGSY